jgi:hypothetical protein
MCRADPAGRMPAATGADTGDGRVGSGFSGQDARCYGGGHRGRRTGGGFGGLPVGAKGGANWPGASPVRTPEDLDAGDSRLLYKCSVVVAPGTSRPEATV